MQGVAGSESVYTFGNSSGDFPDVNRYRDILSAFDISKFPKLDKNTIKQVKTWLLGDMISDLLIDRVQPRNEDISPRRLYVAPSAFLVIP